MLQRMLGSHPDVHTVSEPWLMLHPLYALRKSGYEAEYGVHLAQQALLTYLQSLPEGEEAYLEGCRRMYGYLYARALEESDKLCFLDKTPRYYFILPELKRVFPDAQYIILFRNPLAVLGSVLKTWVKERWLGLYRFEKDLLWAPDLLVQGVQDLGEQAVVVHYEQLVQTPDDEVRRICEELNLEFTPEMVEYGHNDLPQWRFGDQEDVYKQKKPTVDHADKWIEALDDPQIWRLMSDYLEFLGHKTVEQMGYNFDDLRDILKVHRPSKSDLWMTFSLAWLLKVSRDERSRWEHRRVRIVKSLRRRGVWGALMAGVRKVSRFVPGGSRRATSTGKSMVKKQ